MTAAEKTVWAECAGDMPWLHSSHRLLLRIVCKLAARMDEGELGVQATSTLSAMLSKLGATPTSPVLMPDRDPDDDEFFSRFTH